MGAFGGTAGYFLSELEGVWAVAVPAALVGLAVGVIIAWAAPGRLWRRIELSEVKLEVPKLGELTFVIDREQRKVAWKLFIEVMTRVATQPLAEDTGNLREALSSLYSLFATTRDLLKGMRPSPVVQGGYTVEHLAVFMLNRVLRPFLSKWHPRLKQQEDAKEAIPVNLDQEIRAALKDVQDQLSGYAHNFGTLAEVEGLEKFFEMDKKASNG